MKGSPAKMWLNSLLPYHKKKRGPTAKPPLPCSASTMAQLLLLRLQLGDELLQA